MRAIGKRRACTTPFGNDLGFLPLQWPSGEEAVRAHVVAVYGTSKRAGSDGRAINHAQPAMTNDQAAAKPSASAQVSIGHRCVQARLRATDLDQSAATSMRSGSLDAQRLLPL